MNIGRLKTWLDRSMGYVSMLNFLMIFYMYVSRSPFEIPWYYWFIVIAVGLMCMLYIDLKIIFPQSQEYISNKNPEWVKMVAALNKIQNDINELKKKC